MKPLYEGILSDIETTISTGDINVKKITIVKDLYSNNKNDILKAIDDLHDVLKTLKVKTIKDVNKIKSSYNSNENLSFKNSITIFESNVKNTEPKYPHIKICVFIFILF